MLPTNCPAPLIWRKGEGWSYERGGITSATNPNDQLALAKQLQEKKQYDNALGAYRRVVRRWPTSFAAQDARMGTAECLSALGYYYKAFKEYQALIEKHPNSPHFETALQRQFEIGNLFLAGEKHKVWHFRIFSGLDKAVEVYEQVVKNGPFSKVGPDAQFRIGLVFAKQQDYISAVHAYEKFLERYARPLSRTSLRAGTPTGLGLSPLHDHLRQRRYDDLRSSLSTQGLSRLQRLVLHGRSQRTPSRSSVTSWSRRSWP